MANPLVLPAALLAGGGVLGSILGKSDSGEIEIPPQVISAMNRLLKLGKSEVPDIPTQGVAGLTDIQQTGRNLLSDYISQPLSDIYKTAVSEAMKTATGGYSDITKNQFFEPLVQRTTEEGANYLSQLGRRIQLGGMGGSSSQVKDLTKGVSNVLDTLISQLAPYAEYERARQFSSIPILQNLAQYADQSTLSKIQASFTDPQQAINQAILDAVYNQQYQTTMFPYSVQAPILQSVLGQGSNLGYTTQPGSDSFTNAIMGATVMANLANMFNQSSTSTNMANAISYPQIPSTTTNWANPFNLLPYNL